MQQQQQGQVTQSEDSQDEASQPSRSGDDDTWGVGSASAMDNLRRQNFKGRRSPAAQDPSKGD